MTQSSHRSLRVLLAAAALLVAQWLLVQHEVQIEAHAAHTACEWCLTHAPLAGGLLSGTVVVPAVAPATAAFEARIVRLTGISLPGYQTRAPPSALPV